MANANGVTWLPGYDKVLGVREGDGALLHGSNTYPPGAFARLDAANIFTVANTTTAGIGAASGNATAVEYASGAHHTTILTLSSFAVGTSGDAAALAIGALLYTFPAGIIQVKSSLISVGLTAAISVTTDTPEIGLGTTQGSGANATLGAVAATAENIFEGTAVADVAGTVFLGTKLPTTTNVLSIAAAAAHTVYLNAAVTWANVTAAGPVTASGTVMIEWVKVT
jgi:hypothetical protein